MFCEVGSGSGYFTPFLSKAVGTTGRVYAEDPQSEFLDGTQAYLDVAQAVLLLLLQHLRLDVDGVIEEVELHGWNHGDTRTFLDYQFFAVFTPR